MTAFLGPLRGPSADRPPDLEALIVAAEKWKDRARMLVIVCPNDHTVATVFQLPDPTGATLVWNQDGVAPVENIEDPMQLEYGSSTWAFLLDGGGDTWLDAVCRCHRWRIQSSDVRAVLSGGRKRARLTAVDGEAFAAVG